MCWVGRESFGQGRAKDARVAGAAYGRPCVAPPRECGREHASRSWRPAEQATCTNSPRAPQGWGRGRLRGSLGQRLLASRRVQLAPAWPRKRWPRREGSSHPAPATPRAPVAGSGAGARAPRRRRAPRSIDEARGSALAPTLRDSRSGRADLRNGPDGRPRSPPRPSSVPAPPRCALRRPSVERAPVVQGLRELTLEREHAKAMIVWPVGRARQAVRSGAVQGSYVVPPGGRAAHPVLWRSSPHRCAASAVR